MFFEVLDRLADFTGEDYNTKQIVTLSHETTLTHLDRDGIDNSADQFERIVAKKPIYSRWVEQTVSIEIFRDGDVHRVRFQPRAPEVACYPLLRKLTLCSCLTKP